MTCHKLENRQNFSSTIPGIGCIKSVGLDGIVIQGGKKKVSITLMVSGLILSSASFLFYFKLIHYLIIVSYLS